MIGDKAVSALDVSIRAQVLKLFKDLQGEFHLTYLFVARNLDVVNHVCDRVAVIYAGRLVEIARSTLPGSARRTRSKRDKIRCSPYG